MFQTILDLIYPVRCPVCAQIVQPRGEKICPSCIAKLPRIEGCRCLKCGKPTEYEEKEYCNDCERKHYHYERGLALWIYNDEMRKSLADFKYHHRKEYAGFYCEELIRVFKEQINHINPDVLVPIPIHRSKYLERGYNQAEILARMIGKQLDIPVIPDLLLRNKKTKPQKNLSDRERLRNLTQAFRFNEQAKNNYGKRIDKILLVDDIYTTGSTIEACTNELKRYGVTQVFFIVLCIGKGY